MTFTVALLILGLGILIGYALPGPIAALKARWRQHFHKPRALRPWTPDSEATSSKQDHA